MGGHLACLLCWELNCPSTCEGQFSPGQPHKPHSVRQRRGNHLSGIVVADDLERCTRCFLRNGPLHDTCFTLLPMGFTWPSTLLPMPVRSYRTFSPSHPCECNLLSVALAVRSPCPAVNRHRCPVECGLSSTRRSLAAIPLGQPGTFIIPQNSCGIECSVAMGVAIVSDISLCRALYRFFHHREHRGRRDSFDKIAPSRCIFNVYHSPWPGRSLHEQSLGTRPSLPNHALQPRQNILS